MNDLLDRLADGAAAATGRPGLAQWQPALSGDIDIRIDRDGVWWHEGGRIERDALVQLFASILRREADGHHYLVTPVEKWRIRVDDAALLVVDVDRVERNGETVIECRLNTDLRVVLDASHPLVVEQGEDGEPRPYLQLDHGLLARLLRPVYYRLVEWGEADGDDWVITSAGRRFSLGRID
jgi:hypothetical protein